MRVNVLLGHCTDAAYGDNLTFMYVEESSNTVTSSMRVVQTHVPQGCAGQCVQHVTFSQAKTWYSTFK